MDLDLGTIISLALAVITAVAGGFWLKAKGKISQLGVLVKEAYDIVKKVGDVLNKINDILADNTVTKEEIEEFKALLQTFKAELLDVKVAFLKLIGKEVV